MSIENFFVAAAAPTDRGEDFENVTDDGGSPLTTTVHSTGSGSALSHYRTSARRIAEGGFSRTPLHPALPPATEREGEGMNRRNGNR